MPKCIVPWTQMEIGPTGYVRPCAEYNHDFVDEQGNKLDVNNPNTDVAKLWNNQEYKKLRQQFLDGEKPDGCSKCWKQEEQGITSRRQREMEIHQKHFDRFNSVDAPSPVLLDIKLGSLCNLKCRICNSEYSHNWIDDELELFGQTLNKNVGKDWVLDEGNWTALKSIAENLEVIYLSGGEPFLIEKHFELFDYLIGQGLAKNIWLKIHTNGSIKLNDRIINLLREFKSVQLMYSYDDIGARYEYQRPPARWSRMEANFLDAMSYDFIDLRITYTISILNALSGQDMEQWCNSIGFPLEHIFVNFLRYPIYYDLSMLSHEQKSYILERLSDCYLDQEVAKYLRTQHQDVVANPGWKIKTRKDLDNLRKYVILSLDKKSKTTLEQVNPEIARLLDVQEHLGNQ